MFGVGKQWSPTRGSVTFCQALTDESDRIARKDCRAPASKPALVAEGEVVTYGELARQVGELAAQIQSLHIDTDSRVGLAFPNGIAYVALTFRIVAAEYHGRVRPDGMSRGRDRGDCDGDAVGWNLDVKATRQATR